MQSVMQAAAHSPSKIKDALRPTKDSNFHYAGGRWFARDDAKHANVRQFIQEHVGLQERVAVGGTSSPLHAVIHRMLLSLWYVEKCWSNKIGLTNKEAESYRWAVGQVAIDWRVLQWQATVRVHWKCVHYGWLAAEYRNFYIFSAIPPKRRNMEFKMEMHHSSLGCKLSRLYFSARPFTHVLELHALNVDLQMWHALHDTKDRKQHIGQRKA